MNFILKFTLQLLNNKFFYIKTFMYKHYLTKKVILIFNLLILIYSLNCRSESDIESEDYKNTYLTFIIEKENPVNFNLLSIGYKSTEDKLLGVNEFLTIKDEFVNRNKMFRFNLIDNSHSYYFKDEILKDFIYYKFSNRSKNIIYSEGLAIYVSSLSKVVYPSDSYWDSQLVFNKNEIDTGECYTVINERKIDYFTNLRYTQRDLNSSPEYSNYKCPNFESVFRISDFPNHASIKRNFRIINNSKSNIKIKTYKSENATESYKSVGWSTTASWETIASSGGVETIFESNYDYTGPFLFEIYDNNTNQLLWTEKVKYFDFINPNENKLNWRKKNDSDNSSYPYEFYAEYPKK